MLTGRGSLQITTIAAGTLAVVLLPQFRSPEWRPFRAFMFTSMGLSAVIPVIHGLQMYGTAQLEKQIGLSWLVSQGVLYIAGAAIYAVGSAMSRACVDQRWFANGCSNRLVCLNGGDPAHSIYGAARIRSSTSWWC